MESSELAQILLACARQLEKPRVEYRQALDFMQKLGERRSDAALIRLVKNHIPELVQSLIDLERTGAVRLVREGSTITEIEVPAYFHDALKKIYAAMEEKASIPFPDRETLRIVVPPSTILVTDIKKDFASLIRKTERIEQEMVRIDFPEGIDAMYLPAETLGAKLVELAVAKLSLYLHDQRNSGYATTKLRAVFAGNEVALNNLMGDAVGRPGKAFQELMEPGEFTFKFWTSLASLVLQDLTKKKDKSREDHGYCQSSYIIGHFVVYRRGLQQREQERLQDSKRLEGALKKPPYAFSLEEVLALRDPTGVPFAGKHSRQFVVEFLQSRVQTSEKEKLPPLVRVRGQGNREYYIAREFVAPLFTSKLHEAAGELRRQYLKEAEEMLKSGQRSGTMAEDQAFSADVKARVQGEYPLLQALTAPELLFFAKEEHDQSSPVASEITRCFAAPGKLHPLHVMMNLDRRRIVKDAAALLPAWYTTPVLSQLYFLMRRLISGSTRKKKAPEPEWTSQLKPEANGKGGKGTAKPAPVATARGAARGAAPASPAVKELGGEGAASTAAYRAAVKSLVKELVGSEKKIDATLGALAEDWNPLFDEAAKRNLVTDVDSYIRDFVRSLRRGFRVKPPDLQRIRNLANELSQKEALAKIKKKEPLRRYIEIYMVRLLVRR